MRLWLNTAAAYRYLEIQITSDLKTSGQFAEDCSFLYLRLTRILPSLLKGKTMKKRVILILLGLLLMIPLFLFIKAKADHSVLKNEIQLQIQLGLEEDIGLFIVDYDIGGIVDGSGGVSNADKSLLKRDEILYFSIEDRDNALESGKVQKTILNFRVISEYIDPNYENIYPEEITKALDEISFNAELGKVYLISIVGDRLNGYTAVFNGEAK